MPLRIPIFLVFFELHFGQILVFFLQPFVNIPFKTLILQYLQVYFRPPFFQLAPTFHKNKSMLKSIKDAEHIVEFLPPYSPDLNPIENKWSEKKAYIRKYKCSVEECYS